MRKRAIYFLLFYLQICNNYTLDVQSYVQDHQYGNKLYVFLKNKISTNENIIATEQSQQDLNIYYPTKNHNSVIEQLNKTLSLFENVLLAAYLSQPVNNLETLYDRQNILMAMKEIENIDIFINLQKEYKKIEYELLDILFSKKKNYNHANLISVIKNIKSFIAIIIEFYNSITQNKKIKDILHEKIHTLENFYDDVNHKSNKFINAINFIIHNFFSYKRLYYRYNKKKKALKEITSNTNIILTLLFEFCNIQLFLHLARNLTIPYSFSKLLTRAEQETPVVIVTDMVNIYNSNKIDTTFKFRIEQKARIFNIYIKEKQFKKKDTLKNMLLNVYLSQVFGIAFAKEFILTPFNTIKTNIQYIKK